MYEILQKLTKISIFLKKGNVSDCVDERKSMFLGTGGEVENADVALEMGLIQ